MPELTVTVASHHFVVSAMSPRGRAAVDKFASRLVQWGWLKEPQQPARRAPLRVFASSTRDRSECRFHINLLAQFKQLLITFGLDFDNATLFIERPFFEALHVEFPIQSHWQDRDYQIPVIEYMAAPPPPRLKMVALPTGKGKSYCTMRASAEIQRRMLIVVRPMYIEKWIEDMGRTYTFSTDEIMIVRGSEHLLALLEMAAEGLLTSRIVIISNKTIQQWIKLYETIGAESLDLGYRCLPDQLCELLGAGLRLIDEVHQDFHLNFKLDLYTHVERSISLSATLLADDDFINRMYEIAYPPLTRYSGGVFDKYINAYSVIWKLQYPNKIRTSERGQSTYSHTAFEKSIIKQPISQGTLTNYLGLIANVVRGGHFREDYKPGNRCLVFCATIDMCGRVAENVSALYPNKVVRRYCEEDPFEHLNSDIVVSTLQSAGTAVDIAQLTTVILTAAVSSSQSNIQGFGRLRELKDGTTPHFYYFVCESVKKHIDYHERKRVLLETRAKNYNTKYMQMLV